MSRRSQTGSNESARTLRRAADPSRTVGALEKLEGDLLQDLVARLAQRLLRDLLIDGGLVDAKIDLERLHQRLCNRSDERSCPLPPRCRDGSVAGWKRPQCGGLTPKPTGRSTLVLENGECHAAPNQFLLQSLSEVKGRCPVPRITECRPRLY